MRMHEPITHATGQKNPSAHVCHCSEEAAEEGMDEGATEDTADEMAEEEHWVSVEIDVPRLLVTTNLPPPKETPKT